MARRRGADRRIEKAAGPEGERVARAGPRRTPLLGSRPGGRQPARWLPELLVGAVALATYLNALGGDFVSDARRLILNNPALLNSKEWLAWFTRDYYWGRGYPRRTLDNTEAPVTVWPLVHEGMVCF